MGYLGWGVAFVVSVLVGASMGFRLALKWARTSIDSLTASARTLAMSSQRLIGEAALLKFDSLRRDASRQDGD
jgi:hypothetical protein